MNKKRKPLAEINIVPYIDVMLVLLVIFMITTPMLTQGVDVELPSVGGEKIITESDNLPFIFSINSKGQYFLQHGEDQTNFSDLQQVMTRMSAHIQLARQEQKKIQVLVRADKNIVYERVVELMTVLQKSGAKQIGLLTDPLLQNERANA